MKSISVLQGVYLELHRVLGAEYTDRELLSIAQRLISEYRKEDEYDTLDPADRYYGFYARPVDLAIADGGWNLLASDEWRDTMFGAEEWSRT